MATGALGIIVATEPTEFLVQPIGWRAAFLVFAALTLAVAIFIFLAVPRRDDDRRPASFADAIRASCCAS